MVRGVMRVRKTHKQSSHRLHSLAEPPPPGREITTW
jgi:hypothetical protein